MLSLVIPTYCERNNVGSLIERIQTVLSKIRYEIIVVDDNSPDGTWQFVGGLSEKDSRIRLVKRVSERGLSSAVLEGFRHSRGEVLGVMDADHSHDPALLPKMVESIENGGADCVVGSRRIAGGGVGKWSWHRKLSSNFATFLARCLTGVDIQDPMSGFFCLTRETWHKSSSLLKPRGYKILLELLVKGKPKKVMELPYVFVDRKQDYSKMSLGVLLAFGLQLIDLFRWSFKNQREKS